MPVRPKHMAEEDFAPFFADLYDAVAGGHSDYAREYARHASVHRRNTRRDIIRDHIVDRLRAAVDTRRGVRPRNRNGTTYFHFYGRWLLIVHKLDDEHHIVPNRTQLSLSLRENEMPSLFEGATTVYLGYVEREDEVDVLLVCPDGRRSPWWHIAIDRPGLGEVVPLPSPAPSPDDDEMLVVVPDDEEAAGDSDG